ncbi:MAG TPA: hypothetical protein VFB13_10130 [Reyranella sp.]|jgi:hypothetical protein|nr:hypothetical protein [Reyranella sp.]
MSVVIDGILWIGGAALFGAVGVLLGRRLTHHHVKEGHNDVLVPVFLTAGVIYAVLLAFIVIAEWEFYDGAKANVAQEASQLPPLYDIANVIGDEKAKELRHGLREYAESVIHGWDDFTHGRRDPKTSTPIVETFKTIAALKPATKADELLAAQFLTSFNQVLLARNKRYMHASESLSWLMWFGSIGGGVIVVGLAFFIYMDKTWPHVLVVSVMSGMIGMLFFMIALLSEPFKGPLALHPEPFESSVNVFDIIDKDK